MASRISMRWGQAERPTHGLLMADKSNRAEAIRRLVALGLFCAVCDATLSRAHASAIKSRKSLYRTEMCATNECTA
jgi:hypothetical protein